MVSHACTGPGCPGCYAIANVPYLSDPRDSRHPSNRDPEYQAYLDREQERWERSSERPTR